jgi:hypothetical protein
MAQPTTQRFRFGDFVRPHNWSETHLVLGYEADGFVQTARFNQKTRFKESDLNFAKSAARHGTRQQ